MWGSGAFVIHVWRSEKNSLSQRRKGAKGTVIFNFFRSLSLSKCQFSNNKNHPAFQAPLQRGELGTHIHIMQLFKQQIIAFLRSAIKNIHGQRHSGINIPQTPYPIPNLHSKSSPTNIHQQYTPHGVCYLVPGLQFLMLLRYPLYDPLCCIQSRICAV